MGFLHSSHFALNEFPRGRSKAPFARRLGLPIEAARAFYRCLLMKLHSLSLTRPAVWCAALTCVLGPLVAADKKADKKAADKK